MLTDGTDPWWRDGICAQIGPDLFFLAMGEPGAEAKRACRMCPVRVNCLADALTTEVEHGIFGGLGRDERRRLTELVEAGEDPITVALDAIETEEVQRARRNQDHRRRAVARGRRDRLHPRPA